MKKIASFLLAFSIVFTSICCSEMTLEVKADGGEHEHHIIYLAENNKLAAYCDNEEGKVICKCHGQENKVYLSISGNEINPIIHTRRYVDFNEEELEIWEDAGIDIPFVGYFSDEDCRIPTSVEAGNSYEDFGEPTKIGTYYAAILYGINEDFTIFEIASKKKIVVKKNQQPECVITMEGYEYGEDINLLSRPHIEQDFQESPVGEWWVSESITNYKGQLLKDLNTRKLEPGEYYLYYVTEETANYEAYVSKPCKFIIAPSQSESDEIESYEGLYDGKPHTIIVKPMEEGRTIAFGIEKDKYIYNEPPEYIIPGVYKIYYQIRKDGCEEKKGYAEVIIKKIPINLSIWAHDKKFDMSSLCPLTITQDVGVHPNDGCTVVNIKAMFEDGNVGIDKKVIIDFDRADIRGRDNQSLKDRYEIGEVIIKKGTASIFLDTNESGIPVPVFRDGLNVFSSDDTEPLMVYQKVEGYHFRFQIDEGGLGEPDIVPCAKGLSIGTHQIKYVIYMKEGISIQFSEKVPFNVSSGLVKTESLSVIYDKDSGNTISVSGNNLDMIALDNVVSGNTVRISLDAQKRYSQQEIDDELKPISNTISQRLHNHVNGANDDKVTINYYDLVIEKFVSDDFDSFITDTGKPIEIEMDLEKKSLKDFKILVYRNHEGIEKEFSRLPERPLDNYIDGTYYLDEQRKVIYLYTSKFSDYVIATVEDGHTIFFDSNGGSLIDYIIVLDGQTVSKLPIPIKENERFMGWYTNPECTRSFTNDMPVTTDLILYAKWVPDVERKYKIEEGITIENPEKTVLTKKGETLELRAIIHPLDASNKLIRWSSSDEGIASVDENGLVTAWEEGVVVITASTISGKKDFITLAIKFNKDEETKSLEFNVTKTMKKVNSISLNNGIKTKVDGKKISLSWGKVNIADLYEIYATYTGGKYEKIKEVGNETKLNITISKLNGKSLDMSKVVKFYAKAYKIVDGKKIEIGKSMTAFVVGVKNKNYSNASSIKLKSSKNVNLKVGKKATIIAEILLEDSTKKELKNTIVASLRFESDNDKIATVDKNGVIKAKKKGTCYIYLYAPNGCVKKVKVIVK